MDDFVRLPSRLYRDCPQYVPDMERDIRDMFDPRKNAGLGFCEVQPFVAYYWSTPVGRIVGIINHRANRKWERRCVCFGLIEFIDHSEVSQALLSAVEQWGYQRGMDCIQGPLGITDFDKEGMLVEDFDLVGAMTSIYNHAYYPQHMEALGYQKAADWIQFRLQVPEQLPARFERVAQLSKEMFGLRVRTMTRKDVRGGYAQQAFDLFNQCYSQLFGFTEFTLLTSLINGSTADVSSLKDVTVAMSGQTVVITITPPAGPFWRRGLFKSFVLVLDTQTSAFKTLKMEERGGNSTTYTFTDFKFKKQTK